MNINRKQMLSVLILKRLAILQLTETGKNELYREELLFPRLADRKPTLFRYAYKFMATILQQLN